MPLPGRVPSADREFSHALPRYRKSGHCYATADFTDGPARDRSLIPTLHAFPKTKMQAGHSVLVTGFTARLPARPEPRYRRRTGTEPAPAPAGIEPQGNEPSLEFGYRAGEGAAGIHLFVPESL